MKWIMEPTGLPTFTIRSLRLHAVKPWVKVYGIGKATAMWVGRYLIQTGMKLTEGSIDHTFYT